MFSCLCVLSYGPWREAPPQWDGQEELTAAGAVAGGTVAGGAWRACGYPGPPTGAQRLAAADTADIRPTASSIDKLAAELRWADPPPLLWLLGSHSSPIHHWYTECLRFRTALLMFGWGQLKLSTLCCCLLPLKEIMMDLERPQNTFCF